MSFYLRAGDGESLHSFNRAILFVGVRALRTGVSDQALKGGRQDGTEGGGVLRVHTTMLTET